MIEQDKDNIESAALWRRLLNFLIDHLAVYTFILFSLIGAAFIRGEVVFEEFGRNGWLIMISANIGYYILFEWLNGQTFGKMVTRTKVISADGSKPSFGQIAGRTFSRYIPFEALSFFFSENRGWHDSLPDTYVVLAREGRS